jgi:hypothetical protein
LEGVNHSLNVCVVRDVRGLERIIWAVGLLL